LVAKGSATADAVELCAQLCSTTAVVAANLIQLFTPDDRGYDEFNRSAIRFIPDFGFSKIRDDLCLFQHLVLHSTDVLAALPLVVEPKIA
jgi:hypothetical protein